NRTTQNRIRLQRGVNTFNGTTRLHETAGVCEQRISVHVYAPDLRCEATQFASHLDLPPSCPLKTPLLPQRHEHRHTRLGPDLPRRVPLPRQILGDQDVARAESAHRPVPNLDIDRAREREYGVAAGRVVPWVRACRLETAHDDAAAGNQLGGLGLVTARLEFRHDLLEVRLTVGTGMDSDDGHGDIPALKVASRKQAVAIV